MKSRRAMHPNAERRQPETCRAAGAAHDQVNENKTSVQTQPSLLALRRWGRFAGETSIWAQKIPY